MAIPRGCRVGNAEPVASSRVGRVFPRPRRRRRRRQRQRHRRRCRRSRQTRRVNETQLGLSFPTDDEEERGGHGLDALSLSRLYLCCARVCAPCVAAAWE